MNNFRQNLPESLLAPDLSVSLSPGIATCTFDATVCNEGDFFVPAGVIVRFYDEATQSEFTCNNAPVATTAQINPGQCETILCDVETFPALGVSVRACVDNDDYDCTGGGVGGNHECREENNLATMTIPGDCGIIVE